MGDHIEFLTKNLKKEQRTLKRLIRDAVKEGEYLIAHYHAERMAQYFPHQMPNGPHRVEI